MSPKVGEAMIRNPKICSTRATVDQIRRLFADPHVHAALVVDRDVVLVTVVERADLSADGTGDQRVAKFGHLNGRTIAADAPLDDVRDSMLAIGRRRLAVIDVGHHLVGLLCLKASGKGFCTEHDVHARALERARAGGRHLDPP